MSLRLATPRLALTESNRANRLPGWARKSITPILLVAVWELAVRTGVLPENLIAPPSALPGTFWELTSSGELPFGVLVSLLRVLSGVVVGTVLAVVFATLAGLSKVGFDAVNPVVQVFRPLPATALTSLAVLVIGIGEPTKTLLIAFGVFFPVYLNTLHGIESTDSKLIEVAAVNRFTHARLIRQVIIPAALPAFFVGFRFSTSVAWLLLVVVEQINAKAGLGFLLTEAQRYFRTDIIMAVLIVYALLGIVTDLVVQLLARQVLPWQKKGPQ